jgi:hypothetical protein
MNAIKHRDARSGIPIPRPTPRATFDGKEFDEGVGDTLSSSAARVEVEVEVEVDVELVVAVVAVEEEESESEILK